GCGASCRRAPAAPASRSRPRPASRRGRAPCLRAVPGRRASPGPPPAPRARGSLRRGTAWTVTSRTSWMVERPNRAENPIIVSNMPTDVPDVELLRAEWIVPVDRPPIRDGRVAVRGRRIVWVGAAGEPGEPKGRLRDLGQGVLLPGLVNAHAHLELSHLQGAVDADGGFVPWVRALVGRRGQDTEETVRAAAARAIEGLAERGTSAVGDVSNGLAHLDLLAASPLDAIVFYELLAWDPQRAEPVLAAAESRVTALRPSPRPRLGARLARPAPPPTS